MSGDFFSGDIFAGQPTDADLLAELYDLEHDPVVEDLVFYREQTRRSGHAVLDLGCGSGRLLRSFAAGEGAAHRRHRWLGRPAAACGGAGRRRAAAGGGEEQGRLHLVEGDVRRLERLGLRSPARPPVPTWWSPRA